MSANDLIGLVEAAYRVDLPEADWLKGVAQVGAALFDRGLGTAAFTYGTNPADEEPRIRALQVAGDFALEWLPRFRSRMGRPRSQPISTQPTEWRRWLHLACGTARSIPNLDELTGALEEFGGARDLFAVNGRDPEGFGLWLGVPRRRAMPLSDGRRALYARVAAHFASGHRLRRTLAGAPLSTDHAEAVLSPSGALLHAEREARHGEARAELRRSVLLIDRARSRPGRGDPEHATRDWRALVDGRWTLVDHFEHDGKRFILATRNAPRLDRSQTLSAREQQILAYAAMDHGNKEIAYELGISATTVRVLIARAARKLGARGRADAVVRYRAQRVSSPKPPLL